MAFSRDTRCTGDEDEDASDPEDKLPLSRVLRIRKPEKPKKKKKNSKRNFEEFSRVREKTRKRFRGFKEVQNIDDLFHESDGDDDYESSEDDEGHFIRKSVNVKKKEFHPKIVLGFVLEMAVSPWIDDEETLNAVRKVAQVNTFRRYVFLQHDWIYRETMRLSDGDGSSTGDDSEANTRMIQEAEFSDEEREGKHEAFAEVEMNSGMCKTDRVEPLHDLLTHLCCVALDPFYSGPKGSRSACQKILKYRELVYQDLNSIPEPERAELYHLQCSSSDDGMMFSVTQEAESSHEKQEGKHEAFAEKVEMDSGTCKRLKPLPDILTHLCCLALDPFYSGPKSSRFACQKILDYRKLVYEKDINYIPVAHTSDHDHEVESSNVQEISRLDPVSVGHVATMTPAEECSSGADGAEYITNEKVSLGTDVEIGSSLDFMLRHSASDPLSRDATCTYTDDMVGVASGASNELLPHPDDNQIRIHPSNKAGAADNLTGKEVSSEMVSEGSSKEKSPPASDFPFEFQKEQFLNPATMPCTHPLSMDGHVSSSNTKFQLLGTEHPTSLHMKFPKDFKLPSKDDLMKWFRQFGPLDSSKTKVFFYTGSAQVFFLHKVDAEAALQYAKRKTLFGQANVRFWLDQHEQSRRGTTEIAPPLSYPTLGSTALKLKSCLRTSDAHRKEDKIKKNKVKILPESQIFSSSASKTKDWICTPSDSCNYGREIGPDISVQMLALLEKCNQLICKTKDDLGFQSYYSMFTHNQAHIPKLNHD